MTADRGSRTRHEPRMHLVILGIYPSETDGGRMERRDRQRWLMIMMMLILAGGVVVSQAHQDPCHRLHSCPSDHNTYVCGDKGRCDQCLDNEFCLGRQPRMTTQTPTHPTLPPAVQNQMVEVNRAIDGDTLELSTGEKVHLIGVDTPETKDPRKPVQYFGKEATAFTQGTVGGKRVRLEYDQQRQDKYGRTLAYVYLENGTFVNAEIIRQGYGFVYTRFPFKFSEQFRQLEREARDAKQGLWGAK
jgi:endonuclease YncB( thermonuclease family)